jgi:hypothetical protein
VIDAATQQPVVGTVTFFDVNTQTNVAFSCSAVVDPSEACPSWQLSSIGGFDLEVSAAGYRPAMIHVLIEGPAGCCGTGPATSDSIDLQPE